MGLARRKTVRKSNGMGKDSQSRRGYEQSWKRRVLLCGEDLIEAFKQNSNI